VLLLRSARRIYRLALALPYALHSTIVIPLIRTPSTYYTRYLIAAGPRWLSLLYQVTIEALCVARAILELVYV
jgi:hypothetical protein